jgi:hypothetical protein
MISSKILYFLDISSGILFESQAVATTLGDRFVTQPKARQNTSDNI